MRNFLIKTANILLLLLALLLFSLECYAWTWPLSNSSTQDVFTSEFGPNNLGGGTFYRFHNGMDLQASVGDTVHATKAGNVQYAGYYDDEVGNIVTISDGIDKTAYFHLDDWLVSQGNWVYEGQPIALSGETGNVDGPHLHFEYRNPSTNHRLHPLQVMPYDDYYLLDCDLVENLDINFTIQLTIATDELDIDSLDFNITYTDGGSYYDEILSVDYSEKQNIPLISNDNDIIVLDNHWVMTVTPEYWIPGSADDYTITFNFQPNQSGVKAYTVEADIYAANGSWDGGLDLEMLIPSNSINPDSQIMLVDKIMNSYPNPFNPDRTGTKISYNLSHKTENPKIEIYNIRGQKVKTLQLSNKPGKGEVVWNGTNMQGQNLSPGIYLYKMINNGKSVDTKKMLLLSK